MTAVSGTELLVAVGALVSVNIQTVDAANTANTWPENKANDDAHAPATVRKGAVDHGGTLELAVVAGHHHWLSGPDDWIAGVSLGSGVKHATAEATWVSNHHGATGLLDTRLHVHDLRLLGLDLLHAGLNINLLTGGGLHLHGLTRLSHHWLARLSHHWLARLSHHGLLLVLNLVGWHLAISVHQWLGLNRLCDKGLFVNGFLVYHNLFLL